MNRKHTEESKIKMSESLKRNWQKLEYRMRMSVARKGRIPWNRGLKGILSEESRAKMSQAKKGSIPWNKGKKGIIMAWNKGLPVSKETKKKLSEALKGKIPWIKGKYHTEKTRRKIKEKRKSQIFSEETRRKLSEAHKGIKHHFYGKHLSEETKQKISIGKKGITSWMKGKHHTEEAKRKNREAHEGRIPWNKDKKGISEETRKKLSEALKGRKSWNKGIPCSEETKKKLSEINRKYRHTELAKRIISETSKMHWQDKSFREKVITATLKGLIKRPTSLEKQMIDIIHKYNLPYKYTGDGSFLIGDRKWNPDFVNTNGEKVCIEVANTLVIHHKEGYEQRRKEYFAKYGWECIVFSTNKLNEDKVLEKLRYIKDANLA